VQGALALYSAKTRCEILTSIEFVNHSSYIINFNGKKLITDPWLEYRVFNEGWQLLSSSKMEYDDFRHINYIWFSHEHPDHFMPRVIKNIPEIFKSNITVLYQKTIDKKVKNFCEKENFKEIIELSPDTWFSLDRETKIMCSPFGKGDSWLAFNDGTKTILNLNDCPISTKKQCQRIKKLVGPVSTLLSQFSYAGWVGNKNDSETPRKCAQEVLNRLKVQCSTFLPEFLIPFASFVVFCRHENHYFNNYINTIEKTYEFIKDNTKSKPVVLYPGDIWDSQSNKSSSKAIKKYEKDFELFIGKSESFVLDSVTQEDVTKSYSNFIKRVKENNNFLIRFIPNTLVYLQDLDLTCSLSYRTGIKFYDGKIRKVDIITKSTDLSYCLDFNWGADTLSVNGCFQVDDYKSYRRFRRFFAIPTYNNYGLGIFDLVKVLFQRYNPLDSD